MVNISQRIVSYILIRTFGISRISLSHYMFSVPKKARSFARYLGLNFFLAVTIVFLLAPGDFMSWEGLKTVGDDILYSFTLCITLGTGNEYLNRWLSKRVPWIEKPTKRFILNTVTLLSYSFLVSLLVAYVFIQVFFVDDPSGIPLQVYVRETYFPMIVAVVITIFLTSRGFLLSWRQAAIEAEKLKTERVASQYESLKNQVNPHFLFNSLNALTSLVYEDQKQAAKFIKKLADVYRYVLDNQDKEVVPLSEELKFVEAYIFLQKIRFEDNLQVDIQAPNYELMILPLSLQMLVENAIKHNIISDDQPLQIRVYQEGEDILVIENNLQSKISHEYSSGLGLKNIQSRYAHLSGQEVKIQNGPDKFIVRLPLLVLQTA
ncbi:MAG: histidine kinase [Bacteroidota bacterium]